MDVTLSANILDPQVSARGAKYALIKHDKLRSDGKLRVTIGDKVIPSSTPFGVRRYQNDDATSKNVDFTVCLSDEARINAIYTWAINCLASKLERFFREQVSRDELLELFKHPIV